MFGRGRQPRVLVNLRRLSTTRRACVTAATCGRLDSDRHVRVRWFVFHLSRSHVMESVPGAVATGSQLIARSTLPGCDPVATAPGTDLILKLRRTTCRDTTV